MFSAGREILSRFIPMTQAKTRNQAVTFTLSTIQDNVKSTLVQPVAIFNVRGTCMYNNDNDNVKGNNNN